MSFLQTAAGAIRGTVHDGLGLGCVVSCHAPSVDDPETGLALIDLAN
jgi:hypothetical protein